MKRLYLSTSLTIIISVLTLGCYTQLDLVDRGAQQAYYYEEGEDSTIVEEHYCMYNPYCYGYYYGYWDPWWYSPRWGFFIGLSAWNLWYPWSYYYPYGYWYSYWWYYDYPYWYGYGYPITKNFGRRSFDRRSVYRERDNSGRSAVRSSSNQRLTDSRRTLVDRNGTRTRTVYRRDQKRVIRSDGRIDQGRPVLRQSTGRSHLRSSPSNRRPSYMGRSSSSSGSSFRSAPSRGDSRGSSFGRTSTSSSSRPSRR